MRVIRNVMMMVVLLLAVAALKPQPVSADTDCDTIATACEGVGGFFLPQYLGACDGSGWIRWSCCLPGGCGASQLCCNTSSCNEPPPGCTPCSPSGCDN